MYHIDEGYQVGEGKLQLWGKWGSLQELDGCAQAGTITIEIGSEVESQASKHSNIAAFPQADESLAVISRTHLPAKNGLLVSPEWPRRIAEIDRGFEIAESITAIRTNERHNLKSREEYLWIAGEKDPKGDDNEGLYWE